MAERTGEPTTASAAGGTHTLGLLYPPAGRNRDYTTMQLAFIGGVAEAATRYGYDLLLSPAATDDAPSFRRTVGEEPGEGVRSVDGEGSGEGVRSVDGEGPAAGAGRVDGVIVMEIRREDDRVEHLATIGFP